MSEETLREEGFTIFKNGLVKRLSTTHYVVKSQKSNSWHLIELKEGKWLCDCGTEGPICAHVYATQFHRYASKEEQGDIDEAHLKCRYCGSPDLRGCGFRYNARGIARRYFCNECERKFSIKYVGPQASLNAPSELLWVLNELSVALTRIDKLLFEANIKLSKNQSEVA